MKLIAVLAFALVLSAEISADGIVRYDGYQVYQVIPVNDEDLELLHRIESSNDYDFWSHIRGYNIPVVIMVSPFALESFNEAMRHSNMFYKIMINDVERMIEAERKRQESSPMVQKGRISFTEYNTLDVIVDYIHRLAEDYPEKCSIEQFGTSYEGRPLYVLRIGTGPSSNPSIIMDGGIHAREWISPAVMLYVIQELVENDANADMIANVNWIMVPVLNVDGYVYSHTTNRMWRKSRRVGENCIGVDMNRNFDFHWMGPGTSDNECSETFAGPYAFSEPETLAFSQLALDAENLVLALGWHSYGQWLLYPWGFTTELPENADELQELGDRVAEAIAAVNGTIYVAGTSPQLTYYVSGTTKDWMLGVGGARLSYTVELPGGGNQGFDLPADRIIPVCEETWPGVVVYYQYVLEVSRKMK